MPPVRVRFAPSPTGYLHIGGARTALFNWLWARKEKGTFILRIEDTDRERSTTQSVQAILDGMKWLGLDWDEGPGVEGPHAPYFQTQRLAIYEKSADELIAKGRAYRCVCTKEELDKLREQAAKEKRGFKYPGTCRDRGIPKGTKGAVVRFRMPDEGATAFRDLVKGEITTQHKELQDEVILRADGVPLYNFGAVVDDVTMEITLVARGDDHIVNTPRQILMYQALGYPVPVFAHLPMILGADKQRLSKRHGAVMGTCRTRSSTTLRASGGRTAIRRSSAPGSWSRSSTGSTSAPPRACSTRRSSSGSTSSGSSERRCRNWPRTSSRFSRRAA